MVSVEMYCIYLALFTHLLLVFVLLNDQDTISKNSSEAKTRRFGPLINVVVHHDMIQCFGIDGIKAVDLQDR